MSDASEVVCINHCDGSVVAYRQNSGEVRYNYNIEDSTALYTHTSNLEGCHPFS